MPDNPLAGLDVETRAEFNMIIKDIIASGITVIMATSPLEIPEPITNIAILRKGTLTQQMPANRFDVPAFNRPDNEKPRHR